MYTVDYFINKFEGIPDEQFCRFRFRDKNGRMCANGHCLTRINKSESCLSLETRSLYHIFDNIRISSFNYQPILDDHLFQYSLKVACINNGLSREYQQVTPKQRILAALHDIKKMQEVVSADTIINAALKSEPEEIVVNEAQN